MSQFLHRLLRNSDGSPLRFASPRTKHILMIFILVGVLFKFYSIHSPWTRKDHYNFGGVHSTFMTRCLKKVPLDVSKGIVMARCEDGQEIKFYNNHPPTLVFETAVFTTLLGTDAEWTFRLFSILFSILNLYLVFRLARFWRPSDPVFPYWAAAFHSLLLFTLYFGSHVDFISEFALTPILLSWLAMLKGRTHWAGLATVWGGLSSWSGFLNFGGLLGYQLIRRKQPWAVILWGAIGFAAGLSLMMWLKQSTDILGFVQSKIAGTGYSGAHATNWTYPLRWLYSILQSNVRYISPAFLLIVILELAGRTWKREWSREITARTWLITGGGLIYMILGRDLFFVHEFLFIYLVPFFSITAAEWMSRLQKSGPGPMPFKLKAFAILVGLIMIVSYPYGVLQTNFTHDVINSVLLIIATVGALRWSIRGERSTAAWLGLIALAGAANISQMINSRNQPHTDYEFCQRARAEYAQTGQPVQAPPGVDHYFTRDLYCEGIPLIEPVE